MTVKLVLAVILVVAVLLAWVRLALWRRAAPASTSAPVWRFGLLLALQPIWAALLFLCLFPPGVRTAVGTLVVATAGAPRNATAAVGARLILLPEATPVAGAEYAPDLATALRRHPGTRDVRVLGRGLTARDRDGVQGIAVAFDPAPLPQGLVSLQAPPRVAPGAGFQAGGQVSGPSGATIDLIDPAGRVTDTQKVGDDGRFVVSGTARTQGLATFAVRLRDARGRIVEQADLPVSVEGDPALRVLIVAGAPGPEVKYLRRWATDAGFAVTTRVSTGGGIALGDAPIAINTASLRRFDVVIIDDRSWAALGGQRADMLSAVRDGLGLVLRSGGALDDAGRAQWRSLGFTATGRGGLSPIGLPAADDPAIARTRRGIAGPDTPDTLDGGEDILPEISRMAVVPGGADVVPLLHDAGGVILSAWRASGRGRIAVFTGIDSFGLTLTGRDDLYGDWWGTMLSAVARPTGSARPALPDSAWVGDRVSLCALSTDAQVERPDGAITKVRIDPGAGGCAGFWPTTSGWHQLRIATTEGAQSVWPFFVQPAERLVGVRAARDRDATLMLRNPGRGDAATVRGDDIPGSSWPWGTAWLVLAAGLWWLERSALGRPVVRP